MPLPSQRFHLLSEVDFLATPGAAVWVGPVHILTRDEVRHGLGMQGRDRPDIVVAGLGGEAGGTTGKPVTLGAELPSVAGRAVDLALVAVGVRAV